MGSCIGKKSQIYFKMHKKSDECLDFIYNFLTYPIIGIGIGNFKNLIYKNQKLHLIAHNYFLNIIVEIGIIGLLLFLILIYCACKDFKKINKYLIISFVSTLFFLLFSNLFDFYNL